MRAESQGLRLILRGARLRAFSGSPSVLAASLTHTTRWSRRLATQTLYDVANARTAAAAAAAFSQHRTDMEQIQSVVRRYADRKPAPLPLQFLNEFGHLHSDSKRLLAASWLKDELPVRLSRRVLELELLPRALCNMPSILAVRETYRASLLDIVTFPSLDAGGGASATATKTNVAAFGALLESIYARHQHVAHDVARGMLELRAYNPAMKLESDAKLQRFLDNFFRSRIAIRLMIGHYLATRDAAAHPSRIGIVNRQCSPAALARRATAEAQELARRYYRQSVVPEVCVLGHIDARFPYVDEHVYFCLRETLKNAMRAVIEKHADDRLGASYIYTPIRVVIARGTEDVSVRVTDNGVGMSLRELPVALCFGYTTAPPPALHSREKSNIFDNHVQAAGSIVGMGYGLPLSRLTAQFLGGDMELMSMQGAGTDVTFHFPRLPTA